MHTVFVTKRYVLSLYTNEMFKNKFLIAIFAALLSLSFFSDIALANSESYAYSIKSFLDSKVIYLFLAFIALFQVKLFWIKPTCGSDKYEAFENKFVVFNEIYFVALTSIGILLLFVFNLRPQSDLAWIIILISVFIVSQTPMIIASRIITNFDNLYIDIEDARDYEKLSEKEKRQFDDKFKELEKRIEERLAKHSSDRSFSLFDILGILDAMINKGVDHYMKSALNTLAAKNNISL